MKVGERVRHLSHGDGIVIAISCLGVIEVRFRDSTQHVLGVNLDSLDADAERQRRRQRQREEQKIAARNEEIRSRIFQHFGLGEFSLADALYERDAAAFWPRVSYDAEQKRVIAKRETDRQEAIRQDIRQYLGRGQFSQADALYERDAAPFWPRASYDAEQSGIIARREAERQEAIRHSIHEYLKSGDFSEADRMHEGEAATFWPQDSYFELRDQFHAKRFAARQGILKKKVRVLLDCWEFDKANSLYDSECSQWWPSTDYKALEHRARIIQHWVQTYARASLSELDAQYVGRFSKLSGEDYACLKLPKLRMRLARLGLPLDEEQMLACARPEQHRLLRARAGSGKTRTLAAHAALTIHDQALEPDQVLILAFNKKAAHEIGDRVRGAAGVLEFRNARTFHSLAWQLADHAGRQLIFDDGNLAPSRRKQSGFVERLVSSIMNPAFRERLYEFFRRELEQLDRLGSNLSKDEYVSFRRSLTDYTLAGETVKSNGEKFIADFLFEHGIDYKYERVWSWDKQDRLYGTAYRPDFSIIHGGRDFVLEHWAINPDKSSSRVPDWWETSTQDYLEQIKAKRIFWAKRNVLLLETHTGMQSSGRQVFESALKKLLERAGIICRKLEHEELVRRVAEAPRNVSRMAELFLQFISRAKKRGWTAKDAAGIVRDNPDVEPRNRAFHELAVHAYAAYEQQLADQTAMDFDDLLLSATECVRKHGGLARLQLDKTDSIAIRDLRWILIDEFQDFSELYYRLIGAILDASPSIRVVAVGDDWQAINGFAGAQLTFFGGFGEYFPGAGTAVISTNRRSGKVIVGAGNRLMEGRGVPALAHHVFDGEISAVMIDKVWVKDGSNYLKAATIIRPDGRGSVNLDLARALKSCADFIAGSVYSGPAQSSRWLPSVLMLARTDRAYGMTLADFGARLGQVLREHPELQGLANDFVVGRNPADLDTGTAVIEIMTAHKAKGKEADTVIVLEAVSRQFPKVHADSQLFGPFGVTVEDVLAEERRLFYVATTRAEHRLMFLSETGKESPYLDATQGKYIAGARSDRSGRKMGADAEALKALLDRIDPESLIKENISRQARLSWERLAGQLPGLPEVGYSPANELHAELAWPALTPPVAILTGRHKERASAWIVRGWKVY